MDILRNGIFIAVIAHGLIGVSLIWDKVLLQRPATKSLPSYVFWLGAMSVLGLLLIPFGFSMPSAGMAVLGFVAGVIHLAANWFYYRALKQGEASQTLAVMGGFSPLATALMGIPLLSRPIGRTGILSFGLMVVGGFVMFGSERLNWRRVLPSVLWASGLFGVTNVLQKVVFNSTGFITGYVFFTVGTFVGALALLLRPSWRRQIFEYSEEAPPRSRFWYFVNRFISGVGSFLIFFAISRANPAVVDAISGIRYVIIFLGAFLLTRVKPDWLREDFHPRALIGKSVATGLIVAGLVLVGLHGAESGSAHERSHGISIADSLVWDCSAAFRNSAWFTSLPLAQSRLTPPGTACCAPG
jgi:drug/metabolite transporter (DMT)-like permease